MLLYEKCQNKTWPIVIGKSKGLTSVIYFSCQTRIITVCVDISISVGSFLSENESIDSLYSAGLKYCFCNNDVLSYLTQFWFVCFFKYE